MEIKDSGNRREFSTGAVRDIDDDKGRCDLLPLDCVSLYFNRLIDSNNSNSEKACCVCTITSLLNDVVRYNNEDSQSPIAEAIRIFIRYTFKEPGKAMMELSQHYKQGAAKYKERNWEIGIPTHCYIDSCVRHLLKWYDGWDDEPHDRAVLWNLFGLWWTLRNKPECNDLPWEKDGDNNDRDSES